MSRSVVLSMSCLFSLFIHAYNGNFFRKDGLLYQRHEIGDAMINEHVITVKLKDVESILPDNLQVIRKNQLGFIDLSVPDDMDVLKFYSMLDESGLFEVVQLNDYGEACMIPNDTYIGSQWHLNAIRMFDAWNVTQGMQTSKWQ